MILIKAGKAIDSVLSLHTDMQHNVRPKHKMLHMSHAGAALKEPEVSGLGLMKGERQSSGQGQVKQWLRCTNLSDKLLLISAQDLTLLSSLRDCSFVSAASKTVTARKQSTCSVC